MTINSQCWNCETEPNIRLNVNLISKNLIYGGGKKTICIALKVFERGEGIDLGNGFFVTLTRGILAWDLVKRRPGAIKMIRWGWLVITTIVTSFSKRLECYISQMSSLDSFLNVFVFSHFTSLSKQRWPFCSVSYSCSHSPVGPPLAGTLDNVRGEAAHFFWYFFIT